QLVMLPLVPTQSLAANSLPSLRAAAGSLGLEQSLVIPSSLLPYHGTKGNHWTHDDAQIRLPISILKGDREWSGLSLVLLVWGGLVRSIVRFFPICLKLSYSRFAHGQNHAYKRSPSASRSPMPTLITMSC